jgi:hypothetical protein
MPADIKMDNTLRRLADEALARFQNVIICDFSLYVLDLAHFMFGCFSTTVEFKSHVTALHYIPFQVISYTHSVAHIQICELQSTLSPLNIGSSNDVDLRECCLRKMCSLSWVLFCRLQKNMTFDHIFSLSFGCIAVIGDQLELSTWNLVRGWSINIPTDV